MNFSFIKGMSTAYEYSDILCDFLPHVHLIQFYFKKTVFKKYSRKKKDSISSPIKSGKKIVNSRRINSSILTRNQIKTDTHQHCIQEYSTAPASYVQNRDIFNPLEILLLILSLTNFDTNNVSSCFKWSGKLMTMSSIRSVNLYDAKFKQCSNFSECLKSQQAVTKKIRLVRSELLLFCRAIRELIYERWLQISESVIINRKEDILLETSTLTRRPSTVFGSMPPS